MRHPTTTFLLVSLLAALAPRPGRAGDCSPLRLDQRGGALSRMEVLDQGTSDLCGAYTAAQLIDAWRISHRWPAPERRSSPVAAAVELQALDGTRVDAFYEHLRSTGACDHASVEAFSRGAQRSTGSPLSDFTSAAGRTCPKTDLAAHLACGVRQACGRRIDLSRLPRLTRLGDPSRDQSSVRAALDARLEAGQPVGIIYCMSALRDGRYRFYSPDGRPGVCDDDKHASIVIGRRPGRGSGSAACEYLVRNTYGPECRKGDNDLSTCERGTGQVWMDVVRNAYSLYWLDGE